MSEKKKIPAEVESTEAHRHIESRSLCTQTLTRSSEIQPAVTGSGLVATNASQCRPRPTPYGLGRGLGLPLQPYSSPNSPPHVFGLRKDSLGFSPSGWLRWAGPCLQKMPELASVVGGAVTAEWRRSGRRGGRSLTNRGGNGTTRPAGLHPLK